MKISAKPWKRKSPPKKILAIRLQAMGDMVITLPYLQHLRNSLPPETKIDFLTRKEVESIPKSLELFNNVYSIGGGRNYKKQFFYAGLLLPQLFLKRYDLVIDLQNNELTKMIRKLLMPKAWSEFDRFSPVAAGDRVRSAIESSGLSPSIAANKFGLKDIEISGLLLSNGWKTENDLVVLNPAGAFETRNWPLNNYIEFSKLWLQRFPRTQFLIMGTGLIEKKAGVLKKELGDKLIDLVNKTTPAEAFAVLQKPKFVLSEDSGLMHMAWVSGIPTVALFGSTTSYMARPLGDHSLFFDSSDLECGNCMLEICKWGDNRCLTRYPSEMIFEKALKLLSSVNSMANHKDTKGTK
jgi:heptosyltransferase-2